MPVRPSPVLEPGVIGRVRTRNRLVRAGTATSMATPSGEVTDDLADVYGRLARHEVGLVITGHLYVDERGKGHAGQAGIHDDAMVPGLSRLAARVHRDGGVVFAQLGHAGTSSRVPGVRPVGPSAVANPLTGRVVPPASASEIQDAVAAFGRAAARAVEAGFDGVHVHGANGYLIGQFASPLTNRRDDEWSAGWGGRFPREVVTAVRGNVPEGFPVTMKIGVVDVPEGGIGADGSLDAGIASLVRDVRLDAVEVSCNVMRAPGDSAHEYVAVTPRRARQDWLLHRMAFRAAPEAYYRPWAAALAAAVDAKIILVGGLRTVETMDDVLRSGDADFVAMARPFIREPDLAAQIVRGRRGLVDCTSCNLCLVHSGRHPLRCWRVPRWRLLQHAWHRLTGELKGETLR